MSIFGGIKSVIGAATGVMTAPLKLMSGDVTGAVGDVVNAPFKALGGVLETAVGAVTLPIRLPLMMVGSVFGVHGGSPEARTGAQNAVGGYMQSRGGSPGYW